MQNPLEHLKIDSWYKVPAAVGAALVVASVVFDVKFTDNITIFFLGLGSFLLGLGEWMNHPYKSALFTSYGNPGVLKSHSRDNCVGGCILLLLGCASIAYAAYRAYRLIQFFPPSS